MLGRSEFMPSWNKEFTDAQVKDVVAFLHSVRAPRTDVK